jgi:hypothetical protein
MKKLMFVILLLLIFTACEVDRNRVINPPIQNERRNSSFDFNVEFRGEIYSPVYNNAEIYSITDARTGKKYLVFMNNDGVTVIEDKPKETQPHEEN